MIPDHSDAANAVGAITGQVVETVELLIRPDAKGYTLLYSLGKRFPIPTEIWQSSKMTRKKWLELMYGNKRNKTAGIANIEVYCDIEDVKTLSVLAAEERYFLNATCAPKPLALPIKFI